MNHQHAPAAFGPRAQIPGATTRPVTGPYPPHGPRPRGSPYNAAQPSPPPPHPSPLTQGPPFGPSGAPLAAPKRKRGRIVAAVVLVLTVACGGAGAWMTLRASGDQDAIIATMSAFNDAIAAGDAGAMTAQMCAEEAALLDGLELPAGAPPEPDTDGGEADVVAVGLADLQVKGGVAAATVTGSPDADRKVYFRREGEQWKVCSFAKADFDAAA